MKNLEVKKTFESKNISMPKGRIPAWDIIKLLTIFGVIWGHCIQGFLTSEPSASFIYRFLYSYHMPLFMTISGYFSVSSMTLNSLIFIKKKFLQLIYPCIIWGIILWIILECSNSFHYGIHEFSISNILTDLYWLSNFWYLKSCFICYILAYIGMHSNSRKNIWIPTTLLISQAMSPFMVSFLYPCFIIGLELRQDESFFRKVLSYKYIITILFLTMLCLWNQELWNKSHGFSIEIFTLDTQDWVIILLCRLYRLLLGIVGSLSMISILYNIFNVSKTNFLTENCSKWGKHTLKIYILQSVVLEKGISQYINLDHTDIIIFHLFIVPIFSLLTLITCIAIIRLIERVPLLNRLLW